MTIQFQCAFCKQPIEVDDEFASQSVGCPYCQKTVTAPVCSTLGEASVIPMASPAGGLAPPTAESALSAVAPQRDTRNTIAVVAFGLACGLVLLMLLSAVVLSSHALELKDLAEKMDAAGPTFQAQFEALNAFIADRGGVIPTWLMMVGFVQFVAWIDWLATVVCGLIALRSTARRGFAISSLAICGMYLVLSCGGMFI